MKITVNKIVALNPCSEYPRERITELFGDREYLTPREVAELKIPIEDRLWAVCLLSLDQEKLRRRYALDVVHLWDAPPEVIEYLETGDESLRAAASAAARAAVGAAARDAVWDAARAAAWAAVDAAAWTAATSAARAAAWAAARAAARDAVWDAARAAASIEAHEAAEHIVLEKYLTWAVEACEEGEE